MHRNKLIARDFKCDVRGCRGLSFMEVYVHDPDRSYWSYLCLPHFILTLIFNHDNGWCLAEWVFHLPLVHELWNWWASK